ncbi:MAG TPA: tetratricopeptide repeat protein [Aestuariivirga sp.]|nr:tetratricopeptide repeat protein [Aestuariivirga sp.]
MNRPIASLVLLLLLSATPAAALSTGAESLSGAYLVARSAAADRDARTAADALARALELDPGNQTMTERLMQYRVQAGQIAEATVLAKSVLRFDSQQRLARTLAGLDALRNHRFERARAHFAESAYSPIGELTAALLSAWAWAGDGKLDAALKELDKLDKTDSFANFKSFHGALIADFLKNSMRADALYRKANEQAGTSLRVAQAYGNFLERQGRRDQAEAVYAGFLASGNEENVLVAENLKNARAGVKPRRFIPDVAAGVAEALFSLAAATNGDQTTDIALMYGQLALSFGGDEPVTNTLLGDIFGELKIYDEANAAYDRVPAASVLRNNADIEIATNYERMDKTEAAEKQLNQVLGRSPDDLTALMTLGNVYRNNENFDKAAAVYDRAVAQVAKPGKANWRLFYYRGIARERLKRWPEAEADFRKALELSPDEPPVLNYLGYSMIEKKINLDEAMAMVKKAVDVRPNDGYIVDSLGWAYYQLGKYDEALPHLERAVELASADPTIAEHLGDVYWQVGRKLEAKFQWQHAKDNKPEPADLARVEAKIAGGLDAVPPTAQADTPSSMQAKETPGGAGAVPPPPITPAPGQVPPGP